MKQSFKIILILILAVGIGAFFSFKKSHLNSSGTEQTTVDFLIEFLEVKYQKVTFDEFLYVGIKRQKLFYIKNGTILNSFDVSTATKGAGNSYGSNQTPVGLHTIEEKIGKGIPVGGVFKEKKYTGKTVAISQDELDLKEDAITTRILSLSGQENGLNSGVESIDSFHRRIYIHGTPEEGLIGSPASHGCVRMRNQEIINLFDLSFVGMKVIILNN